MAWSVLQSKSAASVTTTAAATFGTNLSSGSKLLAFVGFAIGPAISSVSDGTNSFSQIASLTTQRQKFFIYVLDTPVGDVGTTPTITATVTGSPNGMALLVQEVSGLATGSTSGACLDGSPGTDTNNNQLPGAFTVPAYSSSVASEYLVAVWSDNGDTSGVPMGTIPSGFTADANNISNNGIDDIAVVYKNSTGGAEGGGTWNPGGSNRFDYSDVIVAFKLGSAAAVTDVPYLISQNTGFF